MSETDVIHAEIRSVREDVSEIRSAMGRVAEALERLARLEERQAAAASAQERAFSAIGKIEIRLSSIEQAQPQQRQVTGWISNGAWAAVGMVVMIAVKKLGVV